DAVPVVTTSPSEVRVRVARSRRDRGGARMDRAIVRRLVSGAGVYAALVVVAWAALTPILWALSGSLKSEGAVTDPAPIPADPQWSNYTEVFDLLPLGRMLLNTTVYATCVTA